ncbi:MAG: SDR family oxidoreductase [Candidatus Omnitrophota bacterium]
MSKKILILGATGMLGYTLFRQYVKDVELEVYATAIESTLDEKRFKPQERKRIYTGVQAENFKVVEEVVDAVKPDVIINAIGLTSAAQISDNLLSAIMINSELPHRLAYAARSAGARLIHIGTDGVFDGKKGMYTENDAVSIPDAYGMTKFLGEVRGPYCVTIRTSIIGHSPIQKRGLVEWFLAQNGKVKGYTKVIYSGFPTVELAGIIRDHVIPHDEMSGVYHVSSLPISKYDLLKLIAQRYGMQIEIEADDKLVVDRSLDSSRFRAVTGYCPPSWEEMIDKMYRDHTEQ